MLMSRNGALLISILLFISKATRSSAQTAPQLSVNGSESVTVKFDEEKGQVLLFSGHSRVSITDSDSTQISEATLILEPGDDVSLETLRLNASLLPERVSSPQSNCQSEQGLLTITGDYTAADYESILSAVEYVNTNKNPDDLIRPTVTCRVQDASNLQSNNVTVSINIMAFNDPPTIYLGGPSQLNHSVTLSGTGSSELPITNWVQFQDPDTTSLQSVQLELESRTTSGDLINLNRESLVSTTGSLQQDPVNINVYNLILVNDRRQSIYAAILPLVSYSTNPSAVLPGTRVVRITALDVELETNAGSRLPGVQSQPSFIFIHVGVEAPTTPSASTTEQQTQPTTTEIDASGTTTTCTLGVTIDSTTTTSNAATESTEDLTCPEELNLPLIPGSTLGLLVYNWTQTPVEEDHMGQPCPMVCLELAGFGTKMDGKLQRRCATIVREDGRKEAEWSTVDITKCGLSMTALQLCENSLNLQSPHMELEAAVMLTDAVVNITSKPEQLEVSTVAVTTTVVENLTQIAIQQPQVRESYLHVIDNILSADRDTLLESQLQVNSSARLLESLRVFSENAPIGATVVNGSSNTSTDAENFVVYAFDNFGLILEDVDGENFTGEAFSVDLGPVKRAIQSNGSINEDSLVRMASALSNATAAVVVPNTLFDSDTSYQNINLSYNSTGNESVSLSRNPSVHTQRLIFSVFLQTSIFQNQRMDCSEKAIGSIIASLQINSSNATHKTANASIIVHFQEYREACEDSEIPGVVDPTCNIFQVESNAIRYSSEDCKLISSEGGVAKCECSQPGHFGLLFDLKPGVPVLPKVLEVASYLGACLSIICLLLVLIIYLSSRDLRSTKRGHQGQLVINISFALLGLYVVFILSGHVTSVLPLCGLSAALLQFFILSYFAWMAVEALILLFKLVLPFHKFGKFFILRAAIFAWLIPLVIVAVSVGVGHRYYISDFYCRSFDKPFYFGTILPSLLLYVFNWIIFMIILCSFIFKHQIEKMSTKGNDSANPSNRKKLKIYFTLLVTLSLFFGLGWGFGLAATSSDIRELTFVFQLLFCIFVGSQGILVFILHCVRPQHLRKKWKSWFKKMSSLRCCHCCRLNLVEMYPKSPAKSSNNGFSAYSNNDHERKQSNLHHTPTIPPPCMSTGVTPENQSVDEESSAEQYQLTQSAPYHIHMSDSSKSFDNPSYVSISPATRTQSLSHASVSATRTDRASKKKASPLESNPNTEILDLED